MNTTRFPALRPKSVVDACLMAQFLFRLDATFPVDLTDRAPCALPPGTTTKAARRSSVEGKVRVVAIVALAPLTKERINTKQPRDRKILILPCSSPIIAEGGCGAWRRLRHPGDSRDSVDHLFKLHWLVIAVPPYSLSREFGELGNCIGSSCRVTQSRRQATRSPENWATASFVSLILDEFCL